MSFFGFVNCLKQLRKVRRLIDRPKPSEGFTKTLNVTLGQKPYGNDAFIRHSDNP